MVARRVIGDLYEIPLGNGTLAYMQHVNSDAEQLGSAVVRVFAEHYLESTKTTSELISRGATAFYAHVLPKAGETLRIWRKFGRAPVGPIPRLLWYSCPVEQLRNAVSMEWTVWETSEKRECVSSRDPRLDQAEFGMVMSPQNILERIRTGKWLRSVPSRG